MREASLPDPWLGRTIAGKYRIVGQLGRGSTGLVYEAVQEPLGREVAIKILDIADHEPDRQDRARTRFLREASLLSQLSHPHTVSVFDYGADGQHPWLVMELCRGSSLAEVMGDRPMDPVRLVRIVQQVCASLSEAHDLGMVHRDLKPANILIMRSSEGQDVAKVVDFGLAKPLDESDQLTGTGLLVGTPMFMSPEQVRGQGDVDQRSDLYALGVLLYRALTGQYPFEQQSTATVLIAHLKEPPRAFPPELGLPISLQQLVGMLLEKDRERRLSSVGELARHLQLIEGVLVGELAESMALRALETSESAGLRSRTGALVFPEEVGPSPLWRTLRWMAALGVGLLLWGVVSLFVGFAAMRLFVVFVQA